MMSQIFYCIAQHVETCDLRRVFVISIIFCIPCNVIDLLVVKSVHNICIYAMSLINKLVNYIHLCKKVLSFNYGRFYVSFNFLKKSLTCCDFYLLFIKRHLNKAKRSASFLYHFIWVLSKNKCGKVAMQ